MKEISDLNLVPVLEMGLESLRSGIRNFIYNLTCNEMRPPTADAVGGFCILLEISIIYDIILLSRMIERSEDGVC